MKRGHIIALVVIAVAIGFIMTTLTDASQYATFTEAKEMAEAGSEKQIHVVGELKKNVQGDIIGLYYNPEENPNLFTFAMIDSEGKEYTVVYKNPMPTDIKQSEKIVVSGKMQLATGTTKAVFLAKDILLKCPSKYENGELTQKATE